MESLTLDNMRDIIRKITYLTLKDIIEFNKVHLKSLKLDNIDSRLIEMYLVLDLAVKVLESAEYVTTYYKNNNRENEEWLKNAAAQLGEPTLSSFLSSTKNEPRLNEKTKKEK